MPQVDVRGEQLTFHNVRNFDYRTESDFTARYEDRTYDLSKLRGVDGFLVYWGSPAIAHTIMSWQFENAPPLAISIETRKRSGQAYSALKGFFRQYEIIYVVADERDVVGLRTNQVYLYRLNGYPKDCPTRDLRYRDAAGSNLDTSTSGSGAMYIVGQCWRLLRALIKMKDRRPDVGEYEGRAQRGAIPSFC